MLHREVGSSKHDARRAFGRGGIGARGALDRGSQKFYSRRALRPAICRGCCRLSTVRVEPRVAAASVLGALAEHKRVAENWLAEHKAR